MTVFVGWDMDSYSGGVGARLSGPPVWYPAYDHWSKAGEVPYPAMRILLVVHVICVSAFSDPEVVASEGLFRAVEGSVKVNEAVEFHQFWFSVGFWEEVYDCVVVADWAWTWEER